MSLPEFQLLAEEEQFEYKLLSEHSLARNRRLDMLDFIDPRIVAVVQILSE